MDCCDKSNEKPHFVIIGGGSAAFSAAINAVEYGARVTLINDGLPIGGTCVNVGCVPSKTLIRAAEVNHRSNHHGFDGIQSKSEVIDFKRIMEQKQEMVEELRQAKYLDVVADLPDFRRIEGRAKLVGPRTIAVNGEEIRADKLLVATGAQQFIPDIPGLTEVDFLTNESLFELESLPESLIVLGGRFIALESAQMFARLGTRVTILQRSSRILPTESPFLTDELTQLLTQEGIEIVTDVTIRQVKYDRHSIVVDTSIQGEPSQYRASHILVATGRRPNTRDMGLEEQGVALDRQEFIKVSETLETSAPGIYAAGDVLGEHMFVYTAAYEGKLAAINAMTEMETKRDYSSLPWVIFTDPQVAGVGLNEQQATELGIDVDVSTLAMTYVPRAIAARDTRGFIRLIRDRANDKLVGARILAPEGSELLMELTLAIKYGISVKDLISVFHPYLTLSESVKLAAIAFGKSVDKLSCCAT